jgi:hypothetical protein
MTRIQQQYLRSANTGNPSPVPALEETEFDIVIETLAESVLEEPEEELFQELKEKGKDPLQEAEEVRQILLRALPPAPEPCNVVTVTPPVAIKQ